MNVALLGALYREMSELPADTPLRAGYVRLPEAETAEAAFYASAEDLPLSLQDVLFLLAAELGSAKELQGFVNGYRTALIFSGHQVAEEMLDNTKGGETHA